MHRCGASRPIKVSIKTQKVRQNFKQQIFKNQNFKKVEGNKVGIWGKIYNSTIFGIQITHYLNKTPQSQKEEEKYLGELAPEATPPKGVKSTSKKRKSLENDNIEHQNMKKMLKITTSSTKTVNTPSAGKISSSGNPKIEFGKLKQMFLKLESKTDNIIYSNKNANDPIGQPYASRIFANQSEGSTGILDTDLGK